MRKNGHNLKKHIEGDRAGGTYYYTCVNEECEFREHSSKLSRVENVECPAKQVHYVEKEVSSSEIGDGYVVQEWIEELPWKQQTVLLSAIRGCDGVSKHDPSKQFVRPLRGLILKNAEPDNENDTFMNHPKDDEVDKFAHRLDDYPMHWLVHFMHAVEIVGFKHPDREVRLWWNELYEEMVHEGFHLNPETKEQLDERLQP